MQGYPGLDGTITVQPGDRIPLIPKQSGKAYADFQATSKLVFDFNEVVMSSSYARGNENNAYTADGVYYLGPGVSPGYAITNFRAHYDLTRHLQLAVQIDNLFNHEYYTGVALEHGTEPPGLDSVPALPGLHHRTLRRKRPGAECHVLLAGRAEKGLGRTKGKVLINL
jgi:outer membrane receptor protein involved in Fe transport